MFRKSCVWLMCMLVLFVPVLAQEEEPVGGEEYPPECLDGTADCSNWTTIEEWNAMQEELYPSGGEDYPPECLDGTMVCDWPSIAEYHLQEQQAQAAASNTEYVPDETATALTSSGTSCAAETDFTRAVEVRVIQMRSGFTYTATVLGLNGFDPSLAVMDQYGNGLCVDDDPNAASYSVSLPTSGEVMPSDRNAQLTFTYNGAETFADISLWVASTDNQPGEFVLLLEGMVVTDADGAGDPLSLLITPGMIQSGVTPTAYMFSMNGEMDSYIGLIDQNYNWLLDAENRYIACDDAGASCWGQSAALNESYVAWTNESWIAGGQFDSMLSLPVEPGFEGGFYNFVMRSSNMATFGDYVAAFHIGMS